MNNKFEHKNIVNTKKEKEVKEVKLKSQLYNKDNEKITARENNDVLMWSVVIGFVLFLALVIMIIIFVR